MKNLSAKQIILGCTIGFAFITFLFFWVSFYLFSRTQPDQLPPLPEKAEAIVGINLPDWYVADPVVRTADGNIYTYTYSREAGEKRWQLNAINEEMSDTTCEASDQEKMAQTAGELADCRQGNPYGEWCPAPIVVYAVTNEGAVWEFSKNQPCTGVFYIVSIIAGFGGFVVGTIIAVVLRLKR